MIPSVCVLMSTYCGEKYVAEQIDSILRQKDVHIYLYIRDDGSNDNTKNILEKYKNENNNIKIKFGRNIGVGNSFMNLLYSVPDIFDYYAFSDQDDIWDADKVCVAIDLLKKSGKILYTSNQECINAFGVSQGLRYSKNQNVYTSCIGVLQCNMIAGCTFLFDKVLKIKLSQKDHRPTKDLLKQRIHDVWVINVAALTDDVIYDNESHMKYRQHKDNVIGVNSHGWAYDLKQKSKKVFFKEQRNGRSKLGKELWRCFSNNIKEREIIYACYTYSDFKSKKILIKNKDRLRSYSGETRIGITLKIILNLF